MTNLTPSLPPGFRFHPTDEELILHYLRNHADSSPCPVSIIAEVDIYKFDPWELPSKAMFGDREWYFFTPRDRKYPNGVRPNRAAASGYWKATGTDKPVLTSEGDGSIGVKKALVFYKGKPPRGIKTGWIMHEYRLSVSRSRNSIRPMKLMDSSMRMRLDDWVLCRIYQKGNHAETDPTNLSESTRESKINIPKSASLTELLKEADFSLLSRLLEAPIETPVLDPDPFRYRNWNQTFSSDMNQISGTEQYLVPGSENSLKRQRQMEEGEKLFHPSKKNNNSWANYTDFPNQFDTQAFFNQQMLKNAHLGME